MTVLIISRRTAEADGRLAAAAESLGWRTFVADAGSGFRGIRRTEAALYGHVEDVEDWAERLGVTPLSPEADALVRLPGEYRLRDVQMTTLAELGEVRDLPARVFLKPAEPTGKDFDAGVYGDGRDIVGPGNPGGCRAR
jgi:hypothetical protein